MSKVLPYFSGCLGLEKLPLQMLFESAFIEMADADNTLGW